MFGYCYGTVTVRLFQVRFQLAQWIEENYIPGVKLNPEDVGAQERGF
jgi:hypothetical protein